ncbi:MAG: hypothetical protein EZS28_054306, partial [Streblomastix strix]
SKTEQKGEDNSISLSGFALGKPNPSIQLQQEHQYKKINIGGETEQSDYFESRLLRPLMKFTGNSELQELAQQIQGEIYTKNPNVKWDDIIGLDKAKRLLKEAVVMPLIYP